jgi:hypothetical protein
VMTAAVEEQVEMQLPFHMPVLVALAFGSIAGRRRPNGGRRRS